MRGSGRRTDGGIRAQLTTCSDRGKQPSNIPERGVIKRTQEARLKKQDVTVAPRLLAWVIKRMPVINQELFEERQAKAENHEQSLGHGGLHAVRDSTRNKERSSSG